MPTATCPHAIGCSSSTSSSIRPPLTSVDEIVRHRTATVSLAVAGALLATVAAADSIDTAATVNASADRATTTTVAQPSSAERRLVPAFLISDGTLSPKSVVATGDGLFFAQNMMYRHTISVFDRSGGKVATISDEVDLAAFGVPGGAVVRGAPVEAAVTPDGRFVYVSNYKMYGPGFNPVATDSCGVGNWDGSYVYKIDTTSLQVVAIVPTGAVPKFLAVSPDGSRLVVSNWCSHDVTIIDTATDTVLGTVPVGRHPRGIAIAPGSQYAFVAVMGAAHIDMIDLISREVIHTIDAAAGRTPRHLLLSPDGRTLYVSNHTQNSLRKIDLATETVTGVAFTGTQTRSMALTEDGDSLFVTNYVDGTVSKVRTADMAILQTVYSGTRPVGITYDPPSRQVWVSNYAGSLRVFVDS